MLGSQVDKVDAQSAAPRARSWCLDDLRSIPRNRGEKSCAGGPSDWSIAQESDGFPGGTEDRLGR
jgi:hypothetical protein